MRIFILLKYIILGIIQGLLEPLPVSSSGHIFILKYLFNFSNFYSLNYEIIVNAGSLLAVLIIYKKDIKRLIHSFFDYLFNKNVNNYEDYKYVINIIVGVIPIMICGLLLKNPIEKRLTNINIIGYAFILTSILLFVSRNKKGKKNTLTIKDSLKVGLFSSIALIPGISRSGTSLVAGLNTGLKRKEALKFSFMMYIPISLGTIILGLKDLVTSNTLKYLWIPYLISFIFSFITTLFSLNWFINKINGKTILYFSIYCLLLGILVLFI